MSKICAIVPTFNRSEMLRECLDSILGQSRAVNQLLVINDGSTDSTAEVLRGYGDKITVVTKQNGGKSSCLNLALSMCRCDYVWICDDDDIAAPDGLMALADALDRDESIDFAFGDFLTFQDGTSGRVFSSPSFSRRAEEPNVRINFLERMFVLQFATLVRRSLYEKVGMFREDLIRSQDYDMALRLSRHSQAAYVSKLIFFQREHHGTRGSSQDTFDASEARQRWMTYDQKIFSQVWTGYALDEFCPSFATTLARDLKARASLIERACVFAVRGMWGHAIGDLNHLTAIECPISSDERHLAESIVDYDLAWIALARNREWVVDIGKVARTGQAGKAVMIALCRPLVWRTRIHFANGDFQKVRMFLILIIRILGMRGTLTRLFLSLTN